MAKKSSIAKNLKRQKLSNAAKEKRTALKERIRAGDFEAQQALNKMPRDTSPSRVRSRCSMCGRASGNYRKFSLCRIHLRIAIMAGWVTGVKKSSW